MIFAPAKRIPATRYDEEAETRAFLAAVRVIEWHAEDRRHDVRAMRELQKEWPDHFPTLEVDYLL